VQASRYTLAQRLGLLDDRRPLLDDRRPLRVGRQSASAIGGRSE
jgi:hypothetical protein